MTGAMSLPANDVELAERVALQTGAPAHDTDYWRTVAERGEWPEPDHHADVDHEPAEDWRNR